MKSQPIPTTSLNIIQILPRVCTTQMIQERSKVRKVPPSLQTISRQTLLLRQGYTQSNKLEKKYFFQFLDGDWGGREGGGYLKCLTSPERKAGGLVLVTGDHVTHPAFSCISFEIRTAMLDETL